MKQALQIVRKDIRRLRWGIALSLVLVAVLSHFDSGRADFTPTAIEGYLNMAIPLVWAFLLAMAVQDESLVNERAFWLTRPYNRSSLVLAKALFAVVVIHCASMLSDVYVLAVRGFNPFAHLPHLFWKQVMTAVVVSAPVMAIAVVTRNLPIFGATLAAVVTATFVLRTGIEHGPLPWVPVDEVRRALPLILMTLAALLMTGVQYLHRKAWVSRGVGVGFASLAAGVFAWMPYESSTKMRCEMLPEVAAAPVIRYIADAPRQPGSSYQPAGRRLVAVPLAIDGLDRYSYATFDTLSLEIEARGRRWTAPPQLGLEARVSRLAWGREFPGTTQYILMERRQLEALSGAPATIRTSAVMTAWEHDSDRMMAGVNGSAEVPGLGRCSSVQVMTPLGHEVVKVVCEQPGGLPMLNAIVLRDPEFGAVWKQRLGDSYTDTGYPEATPLSPLTRRQTFFHIASERSDIPGSQWTVPRAALGRAQLTLTSYRIEGCREVRYELHNVDLSRHGLPTR